MEYQEYLLKVKSKFSNTMQTNFIGLDTLVMYDEVFKWEWLATKLKIFSFITHTEKIDVNLVKNFSNDCFHYACKNRKGLPRGLQVGIVSYSILVSENIELPAITFVSNRPQKHWSAFEFPLIFDLSKQELYYYNGSIIWGSLYDSFFKEYLLHNFK